MTMRLSERIATHMKGKTRKANGHSRALFLSMKNEIEEAVSDGWTLKAIWEVLHKEEKIKFRYGMFRRYALQILNKSEAASINNLKRKEKNLTTKSTGEYGKAKRESKESSSKIEIFEFNPTHNADDYT